MKSKIIFLIVVMYSQITYSQILCDEEVCTLSVDDFIQKSNDELLTISSAANYSLSNECIYPTFLFYDVAGKIQTSSAKAKGLVIKVRARNIEFQFVDWKGESYILTYSLNKDLVLVHPDFLNLIRDPKFWCKGSVKAPSRIHRCSKCHQYYYTQEFSYQLDNVVYDSTYVYHGRCPDGSPHDNLILKPISECGCMPGIDFNDNN